MSRKPAGRGPIRSAFSGCCDALQRPGRRSCCHFKGTCCVSFLRLPRGLDGSRRQLFMIFMLSFWSWSRVLSTACVCAAHTDGFMR